MTWGSGPRTVRGGSITDLTWADQAACAGKDTNLWFRIPGDGSTVEERAHARAVAFGTCKTCPVKAECLEYASANKITTGIWGGTNPGQRGLKAGSAGYGQSPPTGKRQTKVTK